MSVKKDIIKPSNGRQVQVGDKITVHCTGSLTNPPKKFWSTKDPGQQPFTFQAGVGQVIAGWDQGCLTMKQGEIARLTVPGELGYGARGFPAWGYRRMLSFALRLKFYPLPSQPV